MNYDFAKKKDLLAGIVSGDKFKLEEFINELQGFCLGLRLTHWKTTSFELHKAVELTQGTLEGLMDDFVEAFVGMNGGVRPAFVQEVKASNDEDAMIECLKGISVRDTSILNIRDEMLQAVYKLKYLKTLV